MQLNEQEKRELVSRYKLGESAAQICLQAGIARSTFYSWTKLYSKIPSSVEHETTYRNYQTLKRRADKLENMVKVLKTVNCTVSSPLQRRLEAVESLHTQYDVHTLCEALEVSRGTFYNHIFRNKRDNTIYTAKREELKKVIQEIYDDNNQLFGAGKTVAALREYDIAASEKTVSQIMKEMGLYSISPFAKREYEKWKKGENKNVVRQQFYAERPNKIWVGDVTQFKFQQQYYYICAMLDLFSRKIVAYRVSKSNSTQLVTLTFKHALDQRSPAEGLVFHSDRGKQYLSRAFQTLLSENGITQSLSRPGKPHDNAVIESFFSYLKREDLYRRDYKSEAAFLRGIDEYMLFYNGRRPHSTLQYKTPNKVEEEALIPGK